MAVRVTLTQALHRHYARFYWLKLKSQAGGPEGREEKFSGVFPFWHAGRCASWLSWVS